MTNLWPMMRFDARVIAGSLRTLALMLGLIAALSLFATTTWAMPMAGAVAIMLTVGLFSADTTYRLTLLHGALPVRRSTVMSSHYLVAFTAFTGVIALTTVLSALSTIWTGQPITDVWFAGLGLFGLLSLITAPQFVLQVRFGPKAVRFTMILVAVLVFGIIGVVALLGDRFTAALSAGVSEQTANWLPWVIAGIGLVTWVVSYLIARRIYQQQDH